MKTLKIFYALLMAMCFIVVASCNKSDDFFYKGDTMPITITGYNGTSEWLSVKIDTFNFRFDITGNSTIGLSEAYTFPEDKNSVKLSVTEKSTGKLVLEKELKKEDKKALINIIYINGELLSFEPPVPDPNTNKVGLYIVGDDNSNLADLALVDGQLKPLTFIGKNIEPNKWQYFDCNFTTTLAQVYPVFYKSGTSTYYYKSSFADSFITSNPFLKTDGTKGEVRSFLIIQNSTQQSGKRVQTVQL